MIFFISKRQPNQSYPFKFLLDATPHEFIETYLGVYIQIEVSKF